MNRYRVSKGREAAFAAAWRGRESSLERCAGLLQFLLLRNEVAGDNGGTEFVSHTVWRSRGHFESWRALNPALFDASENESPAFLTCPPQASLYDAVVRLPVTGGENAFAVPGEQVAAQGR